MSDRTEPCYIFMKQASGGLASSSNRSVYSDNRRNLKSGQKRVSPKHDLAYVFEWSDSKKLADKPAFSGSIGEIDMRRQLISFAAAAVAMLAVGQANATALIIGSGWQDDELTAAGVPTTNSAWTFTISQAAVLSVVDAFVPGDVYTLTGDVSGDTAFYAGSLSDVQATGFYGDYWTDDAYGKIARWIAPGTYSFSITGDGAGGLPAGLAVRLDAAPVPEPASWLMMAGALGGIGFVMRRRPRHVRSYC